MFQMCCMGTLTARAAKLAAHIAQTSALKLPDDVFEAVKFQPRWYQSRTLEFDRRFNMRVFHRRAGKTVMEVAKLFRRAVENPLPSPRYAYAGPTYAQTKDIAWMYVQEMHHEFCKKVGLKSDDWKAVSELAVFLPTRNGNKGRIKLYGLDSPKQRIRGLYLDGIVLDEFAWIPLSAWTDQIRAMLADKSRAVLDARGERNQWADFPFTPFGRNHAYRMFQKAKLWQEGKIVIDRDEITGAESEQSSDEWTVALYKASETGALSKKELEEYRADVGEAKYAQEMDCSFDANVIGAVYGRDLELARNQNRVRPTPWMRELPVHTGWDLGFDDATAIWFFQLVNRQVRFIDYYEARHADLAHYVDTLYNRGYRYGKMLFPHDVEQKHLSAGGISLRAQLNAMGVRVTTVAKHRIRDRIAAAQSMLPRCVFDDVKCADGLDRLGLYRRKYDEKMDILSENPLHDAASHGADAFGIVAMGERMCQALEQSDDFGTAVF